MSTLYESKQWGRDADGKPVLVRVAAWDLGHEMRHHEDCRVREELRRSARTATPVERRLELALSTACTCGRRQQEEIGDLTPRSRDSRDNRDPEQVGIEYLNERGLTWPIRDSSSQAHRAHPDTPTSQS